MSTSASRLALGGTLSRSGLAEHDKQAVALTRRERGAIITKDEDIRVAKDYSLEN